MIAPATYLMDGPLMALPVTRANLVGRMATDLLDNRAYADRGDAVRTLRTLGHSVIDVFCLVDDAIYLAKQGLVAEEMSDQ